MCPVILSQHWHGATKVYVSQLSCGKSRVNFTWLAKCERDCSSGPTCASDDDVHLSDDFVQFHQPEAIHAVIRRETTKNMRLMRCQPKRWAMRDRAIRVLPRLQGTDGVDLCDVDDGAHCFEGSAAAFSHLKLTDMQHYHTVKEKDICNHLHCSWHCKCFKIWFKLNDSFFPFSLCHSSWQILQ